MVRRWLPLTIVILLIAVGAGAWHLTTPNRPVALVVSAESLECPRPYPFGPLYFGPGPTVPRGFVPTAAIVCDPVVGDNVAADRTVGFSEKRWEGDFDEVIEWLNRPSEHEALFPDDCGDNHSLAPLELFWLLDGRGRAVQPGHPADSCGLPRPGGLAAIQELTLTSHFEHRISVTDAEIQDQWNCSPTYLPPVAGTAEPTSLSVGSQFCRFESGRFAGTVSALDSISTDGLAPAPECSAVPTSVVSAMYTVLTDYQERPLTVELDGCRRVLADGYAPLKASDRLLALFG